LEKVNKIDSGIRCIIRFSVIGKDDDMLTVAGYSVEQIKDPFGILAGKRYEFILDIEVPEDDELYSSNGLYIRVIYSVEDHRTGIVKYEIFERTTDQYLEFELEDDETAVVEAFCKERLSEADE
jgi:hypothetical protein